jgi:hypothetical protein
VLDDAGRGAVPDIHAEGKVNLGLHRGQIRVDWPAPRAIYSACCCVLCGVNHEIAEKQTDRRQAAKLAGVAYQEARALVGTVEASNEKAAEAAAVAEFDLSDEQRRRLVVSERD